MKRVPFLLFSGLSILLTPLAPKGLAQSIKPGTEIKVRLIDKLDTGEVKNGQKFQASLDKPVSVEGRKVLARGTRVKGQITEAISSGRLKRPASITLVLTSIDTTPIRTEALHIDGKPHVVRNTALIGGGAATGAIIGGIAGGGKGAVIGTAAGAGAGTGAAYVTGKQEIVLLPETELTFIAPDHTRTVTKTPEPAVERNIDRAPEARPATWREDPREDPDEAYDALIFSDHDKWLIRSYFESNYGNLPPGLAARDGNLPPGLEKHMRRDETLPLGLQKRVEPLPSDLRRQLPRLPFGYSRVFLSGRVIILADNGQIVDVMFIYR